MRTQPLDLRLRRDFPTKNSLYVPKRACRRFTLCQKAMNRWTSMQKNLRFCWTKRIPFALYPVMRFINLPAMNPMQKNLEFVEPNEFALSPLIPCEIYQPEKKKNPNLRDPIPRRPIVPFRLWCMIAWYCPCAPVYMRRKQPVMIRVHTYIQKINFVVTLLQNW